jgi:carboxyl-terminal processing protease
MEEYDHDLLERYNTGELLSANKMPIKDSTKYFTTRGRVVFGGGGIIPDVFVPLDTLQISDFFLDARQMIPAFVIKYLDKAKRTELSKLGLLGFQKKFDPAQILPSFQQYASQNGLKNMTNEWAKHQTEIARFLKARIAKHLFDDKGFYAVLNQQDETVQAALRSLQREKLSK